MSRGPSAAHAEGFREDLFGQGYSRGSAAHQIHLMAHLSRWLAAQGRGSSAGRDLTGSSSPRAALNGYAALRSARALAPLLGHLRGLGARRRRGCRCGRRRLTAGHAGRGYLAGSGAGRGQCPQPHGVAGRFPAGAAR